MSLATWILRTGMRFKAEEGQWENGELRFIYLVADERVYEEDGVHMS